MSNIKTRSSNSTRIPSEITFKIDMSFTTTGSTAIRLTKSLFKRIGLDVRRANLKPSYPAIPDGHLYSPFFSPWLGLPEFRKYYDIAAPRTLVSADRCYVLFTLLKQALQTSGDIWECGVYRGGTAAMMSAIIRDDGAFRNLRLFDTFEGMPETDAERDLHKLGDFSDTSLESVRSYVGTEGGAIFHKGLIPTTFAGLKDAEIALCHIDVDIYQSIHDSLDFVWPRLNVGGFVVFDDYGFPSCPGARLAVDEFFKDQGSFPLCLPTGQAVVFKGKP